MTRQRFLMAAVGLVLALLVITMVLAAPQDGFDLGWRVISGGGGRASSADYAMDGSAGQPAAGGLSSEDYRLEAGFWPGIGAEPPTPSPTGSPSPTPTATATPTGPPPLVVNTTDDVDDGTCDAAHCSLREALAAANSPGPETVTFDIPLSDPGYDPVTGVWTIEPTTGYHVPSDTTVDGTIATALAGGGSASRPGIEIDGTTLAELGITGLRLYDRVTLRGLVVNHFQRGIQFASANITIEGCYVGTDPTGSSAKPNEEAGILVTNGATGAIIQDNLLSGNEEGGGIRMFGDATTGNTVRNNRIGTNAAGTEAVLNRDGIELRAGAHGNVVEQNLISGNYYSGIYIAEIETSGNVVRDNRIGTDASGTAALPNYLGVLLFNGAENNVVGPGNLVAYNTGDGVLVDGADSFTSTLGNTITANSITANVRRGIYNFRGGNKELTPPTITDVTGGMASGTACANCAVEVFSDAEDEGAIYEGTAMANGSGNWTLTKPGGLTGPYVTATATDGDGNTSEFSAPVSVPDVTPSPTVSPSPSATPSPTPTATEPAGCQELLVNGDFETGSLLPWSSWGDIGLGSGHSSAHGAWLGATNNAGGELFQEMTIPAGASSVDLAFWWLVESTEEQLGDAVDVIIQYGDEPVELLQTLRAEEPLGQWRQEALDLSAYVGQTVIVTFFVQTDGEVPSTFRLDDVSVEACGVVPPTPTWTPTATATPSTTEERLYLPVVLKGSPEA